MKKIRLGLIGCGKMMSTHANAVDKCTDRLSITAVCDIVRERAEEVAAVLDNPLIVTDYRDLVDHVDAVLIALPHDLHYECGMFFARHKKHVLMEKPLCNTEEECVRLIETCEEEGVTLMCAYPVRYWPGIVKLKELVDSGEFGKIIMMSIWTEQYTHYGEECHWAHTGRLGGGQLFSHGCHYIDLLLWFLGKPVSGTHTGTNVGTEWLLREGTSAVTMKFENGAVAYHGATWGARGTRLQYDFQIQTEKGLLDYQHHEGKLYFYHNATAHIPGAKAEMQKEILWQQEDIGKATQHEINHFADCVNTGATPLTNGRAALESLRVIWKLYDAEHHNVVADLRDIQIY